MGADCRVSRELVSTILGRSSFFSLSLFFFRRYEKRVESRALDDTLAGAAAPAPAPAGKGHRHIPSFQSLCGHIYIYSINTVYIHIYNVYICIYMPDHNNINPCTSKMDPEGTRQRGNLGSNAVQAKEIEVHGDQRCKSDKQVPATCSGGGYNINQGKPNKVPGEVV